MQLLSPKNDLVFKLLFGQHPDLLRDALNGFLSETDVTPIGSLTVLNPEVRPEDIHQKFIVLDVHATDANGNVFNVEMQVRQFQEYPKRTLYYWSKLYHEQLAKGENYDRLRPTFGVHLLDFTPFASYDAPHYRFRLNDCRYPNLQWCDDLEIHLLDLTQWTSQLPRQREEEWLYFINRAPKTEEKTMREQIQNPKIHEAYSVLEQISADPQTRELAWQRHAQKLNENSELSSAERKGREEGIVEGEKKGLAKGRAEGRAEGALQTLQSLRDAGILSDAQFEEQRRKLLGEDALS